MDARSLLKRLVETESPSHAKAAVDRVGAVGEGYHSEREYIFADSLEQRARLIAVLLKYW